MKMPTLFSLMFATLLLAGCAQRPSYDYTAFKESKPTSILVLPR